MGISLIPTKRLFVFILGLSTAAVLLIASWPGHQVKPLPLRTKESTRSGGQTGSAGMTSADKTALARVSEAYGKLPLSFEANEGQFDSRVKFVSRGAGNTMYLTSTEAVLAFGETQSPEQGAKVASNARQQRATCVKSVPVPVSAHGIRQRLLRASLDGANPEPRIEGDEPLPGNSNYFVGNNPQEWHVGVRSYAKVRYAGVYPGVDLIYYGRHSQLEYDFVLSPGADSASISVTFEGADEMRVDESGDLVLSFLTGEIRQHKPIAYQEIDGVRREIAARYVSKTNYQIGFEVGPHDAKLPLVIDPVLDYSTYLGGSGADSGSAIAVDSDGNAYVTGITQSLNFPTTPGAFQTVASGLSQTFVTKLNPSGTALVYSTYLGVGESHGIAVDSSGSAYVVGTTGIDSFPTTAGAFDTTYNGGGGDVFVTKLTPTGSALAYSTYLGSSGFEGGQSIAVDGAGAAYVAGLTTDPTFPITPGAFQSEFRGGHAPGCAWGDAFVSKLNPAGSQLVFSTFLGGSLGDGVFGIAVDSTGHAFVTGSTDSADFPVSAGAFQPSHTPCPQFICQSCLCEDAFVTKFDPKGTGLVYSTFLGGIVCDVGFGIAIDPSGNAYITGATNSPNFPVANPIQASFGGFRDAFITKINSTGSSLVYSSYLGNSTDDLGLGVAADIEGNAYVMGQTGSSLLPPVMPGDAFVAKVSPSGKPLVYFMTLGGRFSESGFTGAIAVDVEGKAYVTGSTGSVDFPVTPGAFQSAYGGGGSDAFVAKIDDMPPFDMCLLDETNGNLLLFSSSAGNYRFTNCGAVTLGGIGTVLRKGCLVTLQVNGPDRRILARVDTCGMSGSATIQLLGTGTTFSILDRNTANNSCVCGGR